MRVCVLLMVEVEVACDATMCWDVMGETHT